MYGYGVSTEQGMIYHYVLNYWCVYDVIWCYMFSFGGLWVWVKSIWPLKRMVSPSLSTRFRLGRNPSGTRPVTEKEDCERQILAYSNIFHHIPISWSANLALPSKSVLKKWIEMAQKFLEEHGLHDINWADSFICGDEITSHSWDRQTEKMTLIWSRLWTQQIWDQPQSHMAMQDPFLADGVPNKTGQIPCIAVKNAL